MPSKPGRGRQWISAYDSSMDRLRSKAHELGMIRNGKGDVGQLIDAIAFCLESDTLAKKILEGVLDTLGKTV